MKGRKLAFLAIIGLFLIFGPKTRAECDCNYHFNTGGCSISKPAEAGHFCKCHYNGALSYSCKGEQIACPAENVQCAEHGTKTTWAACQLAEKMPEVAFGASDCKGYYKFSGDGKECYQNLDIHKDNMGSDCY